MQDPRCTMHDAWRWGLAATDMERQRSALVSVTASLRRRGNAGCRVPDVDGCFAPVDSGLEKASHTDVRLRLTPAHRSS